MGNGGGSDPLPFLRNQPNADEVVTPNTLAKYLFFDISHWKHCGDYLRSLCNAPGDFIDHLRKNGAPNVLKVFGGIESVSPAHKARSPGKDDKEAIRYGETALGLNVLQHAKLRSEEIEPVFSPRENEHTLCWAAVSLSRWFKAMGDWETVVDVAGMDSDILTITGATVTSMWCPTRRADHRFNEKIRPRYGFENLPRGLVRAFVAMRAVAPNDVYDAGAAGLERQYRKFSTTNIQILMKAKIHDDIWTQSSRDRVLLAFLKARMRAGFPNWGYQQIGEARARMAHNDAAQYEGLGLIVPPEEQTILMYCCVLKGLCPDFLTDNAVAINSNEITIPCIIADPETLLDIAVLTAILYNLHKPADAEAVAWKATLFLIVADHVIDEPLHCYGLDKASVALIRDDVDFLRPGVRFLRVPALALQDQVRAQAVANYFFDDRFQVLVNLQHAHQQLPPLCLHKGILTGKLYPTSPYNVVRQIPGWIRQVAEDPRVTHATLRDMAMEELRHDQHPLVTRDRYISDEIEKLAHAEKELWDVICVGLSGLPAVGDPQLGETKLKLVTLKKIHLALKAPAAEGITQILDAIERNDGLHRTSTLTTPFRTIPWLLETLDDDACVALDALLPIPCRNPALWVIHTAFELEHAKTIASLHTREHSLLRQLLELWTQTARAEESVPNFFVRKFTSGETVSGAAKSWTRQSPEMVCVVGELAALFGAVGWIDEKSAEKILEAWTTRGGDDESYRGYLARRIRQLPQWESLSMEAAQVGCALKNHSTLGVGTLLRERLLMTLLSLDWASNRFQGQLTDLLKVDFAAGLHIPQIILLAQDLATLLPTRAELITIISNVNVQSLLFGWIAETLAPFYHGTPRQREMAVNAARELAKTDPKIAASRMHTMILPHRSLEWILQCGNRLVQWSIQECSEIQFAGICFVALADWIRTVGLDNLTLFLQTIGSGVSAATNGGMTIISEAFLAFAICFAHCDVETLALHLLLGASLVWSDRQDWRNIFLSGFPRATKPHSITLRLLDPRGKLLGVETTPKPADRHLHAWVAVLAFIDLPPEPQSDTLITPALLDALMPSTYAETLGMTNRSMSPADVRYFYTLQLRCALRVLCQKGFEDLLDEREQRLDPAGNLPNLLCRRLVHGRIRAWTENLVRRSAPAMLKHATSSNDAPRPEPAPLSTEQRARLDAIVRHLDSTETTELWSTLTPAVLVEKSVDAPRVQHELRSMLRASLCESKMINPDYGKTEMPPPKRLVVTEFVF